MDAIWIHMEGQRYGPYPPAQVAALLADDLVPADADVWWPPAGAWVKAVELHVGVPEASRQPVTVGAAASVAIPVAAPAEPALLGDAPGSAGARVVVPDRVAAGAPGQPATPHRRLPERPAAHRNWPHLPAPERAQHVGGGESPNAWAFTSAALGVAAVAVSWLPPMSTVAVIFAVLAVVVGAGVLLVVARGEPGRGMAIAGIVLAVAALGLWFAAGTLRAGSPADDAAQAQAPASSPVKITIGKAAPTAATTVMQAQVFNAGDKAVDGGMFTVEATLDGSVLAQTTQPLPPLVPGASAKARVVFLDTLPASAEYRVTKVTTLPL